jgi:outer membrane receptor for ferrienterochelin and colicin
MYRNLGIQVLWLVTLIACSAPAIGRASAQTGAISGRVTNREGEAVPYTAVRLEGTTRGVMTNLEGRYLFSNIPVGTYSLNVGGMGHAQSRRAGIQVDAGRTTIADFKLGEKPIVIAGPSITTTRKGTVNTVGSGTVQAEIRDDFHSLPVLNLKDVIAMKAGVIDLGGKLHFRGGRETEILTIVDGVASRNPLNAEGVDLGLLAVESSEQVLGGMDAQYGNALSGVISYTTREGGEKFEGELRYFTDRYGEADKSFNNFERVSTGFGGPFLFPRFNYFFSFEGTYSDTHLRSVARHREHRFLDFIRIGNRQSNDAKLSGKLTFKVTPDARLNFEVVKNATLNGVFNNRWNRQGFVQVIQDSTPPTDGTVTTSYGAWAWYPIDSSYVPMNTADHLPVLEQDYIQTALAWKHTLALNTVYNVRLSRQQWTSSNDVLDRKPWEYQQVPNQYYDTQNRIDGVYYATNGDFPSYERKRTVTYTLNGDVSKRIGTHDFMAGGDINYNDLGFLRTTFPNVVTSTGLYGFDRDEFRFFNPEGSFFVQDRWKYQGLVLNAGVRYDNFSVGKQLPSADVVDRVKTQISPRIGVAYPISDRDVMSFHYGRLFQVPDREVIYQGRLPSALVRGNPNLEPQTTISYQLGIQHMLSNTVFGQFGVYFKDIFGLLTTVPEEVPGFANTVETYVNGDYASARGIEVTLIKKFTHGFGWELNYSYGHVTGTASDPNRALMDQGNLRDQFKPTSEQPLEWDQRHTLSVTLSLANEKNWRSSFVYQFGSGFPYTPHEREERRQNPELVNSKRLPSLSTLSMQGERNFSAWGQNVTLYVQATNLLDAQGIVRLQPDIWPEGRVSPPLPYVVYYSETSRAGGAFLTQDQDGDGNEDWYPVHDPRVFQQGRSIRVGLGVQF